MRTTVDIPDDTYRRLKLKAVKEGRTVRQLVLRGIHREIEMSETKPVKRLKTPILEGRAPGSICLTNEQIYDIIGFP